MAEEEKTEDTEQPEAEAEEPAPEAEEAPAEDAAQEEAGKASPWDWVTTMATAQANFTRDIAEAYAAAGRRLQGGK